MEFDVIIIGGGVVGAFLARSLSRYQLNIGVLEKENDVGNVTSSANSGIIHSGYDPVPNTLKALLNVKGNQMFDKISDELDVQFRRIGSLTLATQPEQLSKLKELQIRGQQNGVETKILSKEEVVKLEPNINRDVLAALYAPSCGIIDPFNLVVHAFENACDNGVHLFLNEEVESIRYCETIYYISTKKSLFKSKIVINAAGLFADKIWGMIEKCPYEIKPRKGEYFVLDHFQGGFVNHVLFPMPSEKGKGVLVTPTTSGNYLVGPSSEYTISKDDFATDAATLLSVKDKAYLTIDKIPYSESIRVFSGLRAEGPTKDFIIEASQGAPTFINILGIDSPGLASSPAVAAYVIDNFIKPLLTLKEKSDYQPYVRKRLKPTKMKMEEANQLIKSNPAYGQIICSCEKVSLGELLDELSRSVPPHSIKAIKRRTRMGFGRCQGGFCHPRVVEILSSYFKCDFTEILYDGPKSHILVEKVKDNGDE